MVMRTDKHELLRSLPAVDDLLRLTAESGVAQVVCLTDAIRQVTGKLREEILSGERTQIPDSGAIIKEAVSLAREYNLRSVVNATGIILHTNLGRAVLAKKAAEHVRDVAENYSNLEYRLNDGGRGSRYALVEELLCRLTGCESALVVNNNAAAVLLMLTALCQDTEVIVSRGELVEIGGSFRVPDVMRQGGAILREVGATNKTRASDYENAIIPGVTGGLLKVHTSNFKIIGFTEEASLTELANIGEKHDIPVLYDLGSGLLLDILPGEPGIQEAVRAGADIIAFSGDKLLGGPQSGILAGRKKYIDKLKAHPLNRALRIDKLTLAALEATLKLYTDSATAMREIPVLEMLSVSQDKLREKADTLFEILAPVLGSAFTAEVAEMEGQVGGGSAPGQILPSWGVSIHPHIMSAAKLEECLRLSAVPIIARIKKDRLLLDVRTIREEQFAIVAGAFDAVK